MAVAFPSITGGAVSAPRFPLGDAPSFMGLYTHDDIIDLEQWSVDARAASVNPTVRIEEPDVSPNLKTFLRFTLGGAMGSEANSGVGRGIN